MYRVVSWERVRAAASPLEGSEEVVMGLGFWEGQDTEVQEREEGACVNISSLSQHLRAGRL